MPAALRERLLVHEQEPLGPRTTLGVGGPAAWVIEPRSRQELLLAVGELGRAGMPFRVLGHGSNLLVSDAGVSDVVIHTRALRHVYHHGEVEHALRCEAGAPLSRLVSVALEVGLTGAEVLIGIPGTVGGAVAGNSGGREGAIGDLLSEVTLVESDGTARAVPCSPADFGYRRSPFKGRVVVDAVVQLAPAPKPRIQARMREILQRKSATQPLSWPSAGCMFRNPAAGPSGRLIEQAGCKGLAVGGARVSERHANFVVTSPGVLASDVLALVEKVRAAVRSHAGVELDLEVECWGQGSAAAGAEAS
ncbi:MAG: UDP-N-acetylmuramate dehydrogenase [Planctomycetes bacterium]|nr:UDP-N-acetylmuramate dehydrogenase [Planctomycetota bacterium]